MRRKKKGTTVRIAIPRYLTGSPEEDKTKKEEKQGEEEKTGPPLSG